MPEVTMVDLLVRFAKILREARGLPEERNVGILYNEMARELGMPPIVLNTAKPLEPSARISGMGSLPGMPLKETPADIPVPKRDCPQCGKKESMNLGPLCMNCEDAEGGKYHTMWFCGDMDMMRRPVSGTGCGFKEKHKKGWAAWLDELGVDWKSGMKKDMGVKTYTDEGLK